MHPLLETLGGLGLFLYGMSAMTSGLRKLAGDQLRHWLSRSTRTPFSGVVTGAITTAIVQSSSATTVAVVGFVGAGLLTFTQALGVIFGANIGTTITGWMVALIGFKLKLSAIALPLLFVAAVLYLFKSHRILRGSGKALAGFCLIFLGISYLQEGLADYRHAIDLSQWRIDHFGGRLLLVIVGGVLTLITQSSSATVATALTGLNAEVLTLPQAAAVIIGADIGTTATAALATVGGTTASKRTGFAHVIYNLMTGIAAFLILPGYLWCIERLMPESALHSREMVAVSFHSFFNLFGVLLALPFTNLFAKWIIRLFPQRTPPLAAPFEKRLLADSNAASEALARGTRSLATAAAKVAVSVLTEAPRHEIASIESISSTINIAREFALQIGSTTDDESFESRIIFASLHELDHIERLIERARDHRRAQNTTKQPDFSSLTNRAQTLLYQLANQSATGLLPATVADIEKLAIELEEDKAGFRSRLITRSINGDLSADQLDKNLDSHRWLRRLVYHAWRIAYYQETSSIAARGRRRR